MTAPLSESLLISRYLAPHIQACAKDCSKNYFCGDAKGLLDDTAFLPSIPTSHRYAVSTDTLVEGIHAFRSSSPTDWANRLLAANLSDLAAQAATPLGLMLSLSLPRINAESFVKEFAKAFAKGCRDNELQWLGGDLTSNPANICISATVFGTVKKSIDPRRANAKKGDALLVTGMLGLSALGLQTLKLTDGREVIDIKINAGLRRAIARYKKPVARWREAIRMGNKVNAMMDLSDGLLSDLPKLCAASKLGAEVWLPRIPVVAGVDRNGYNLPSQYETFSPALSLALTGGEDFELLITAPLKNIAIIRKRIAPLTITQIGIMNGSTRVCYLNAEDKEECLPEILHGYDHFAEQMR